MMKKILVLFTILISMNVRGQDYDLYISVGSHFGLWNALTYPDTPKNNSSQNFAFDMIPYNIHVDKLLPKRNVVGFGYTSDRYPNAPLSGNGKSWTRQNIRVRYYRYHGDPDKNFTTYIGCSVGASFWSEKIGSSLFFDNQWWPTAQFLFGVKVKISEALFWQTEVGAGPPYALQTSIGIKL